MSVSRESSTSSWAKPVPALVVGLAEIGGDELAVFGGKAANLGILTRAGLPVPPGLCVTTDAYQRVAAEAGLESVLDALADTSPASFFPMARNRRRRRQWRKIPTERLPGHRHPRAR